jgi:ubiquinone/menaquinone biosynthesis C-methylase UbiE
MVSPRLRSLVRCPDCRFALRDEGASLACPNCKRAVDGRAAYLDLRPVHAFTETTKYTDAALHADARHERVSPPLLGAGVRNDMLRALLDPTANDRVLDLGCGSGRMMVWNADRGAWTVGVDVAPFFAHEALEQTDLVLGDLRQLPLPDASFDKAWSLDVFEHLSIDALTAMLRETNRVLAPGGTLFVYSHVRKNAWIAKGLRAVNALAGALERAGLLDLRQERLRKSDHVNPLADVPHLEQVTRDCGFRIARIRYYTPIVGGLIENVAMRLVERWMIGRAAARRAPGGETTTTDADVRAARQAAKARIATRGTTYRLLRLVTWVMKIDLLLFGRVRSGPFFALLQKEGAPR